MDTVLLDPIIVTNPVLVALILGACALIVMLGRVDIAIGAYAALLYWAYNIEVASMGFLWIAIGTLFGATAVSIVRAWLRRTPLLYLNRVDLRILIWSSLWIVWMTAIYLAFPTEYALLLFKNAILYCWLPFWIILLFVGHPTQMRGIAYGLIAVSLFSGFAALRTMDAPLQTALQDGLFQLRGLSGINYLTFAVPFSLSIIYSLTILLAKPKAGEAMAMIAVAAVSTFFLVLTGARQSVVATAISILALLAWFMKHGRLPRLTIAVVVFVVTGIGAYLYTSTALALRWRYASDALESRQEFWSWGWRVFTQSPIWGNGYDYQGGVGLAHNLFLDTMAGQGLVGLVYALGFTVLIVIALKGTWSGVGAVDLKIWRAGLLATWIYALAQTSVSGTVTGSPHFFIVSALIWRMATIAGAIPEGPPVRTVASRLAKAHVDSRTVR